MAVKRRLRKRSFTLDPMLRHLSIQSPASDLGTLPIQNIPVRTELGRELQRAFAPDHPLATTDYSQIELRLLAHLHDQVEVQ